MKLLSRSNVFASGMEWSECALVSASIGQVSTSVHFSAETEREVKIRAGRINWPWKSKGNRPGAPPSASGPYRARGAQREPMVAWRLDCCACVVGARDLLGRTSPSAGADVHRRRGHAGMVGPRGNARLRAISASAASWFRLGRTMRPRWLGSGAVGRSAQAVGRPGSSSTSGSAESLDAGAWTRRSLPGDE